MFQIILFVLVLFIALLATVSKALPNDDPQSGSFGSGGYDGGYMMEPMDWNHAGGEGYAGGDMEEPMDEI